MARSIVIALASALLLWGSFPPLGWPFLVLVAPAGFMYAVVSAPSRRAAVLAGGAFGAVYFGALMEWIANLGQEAIVGLLLVQIPFYAGYAALLWGFRRHPGWELGVVATGGWAALEFLRERIPFGGLNWGALGYPLGEWAWWRGAAQFVGTSGLGIGVAALAAGIVLLVLRRQRRWLAGAVGLLAVLALLGAFAELPSGRTVRVAIIQGNSPCPLEHCSGEREAIFENHLRLTRQLEPGSVDLVVWPESATTFEVDPASPSEGQRLVAAEARRLDATLLVGGDRPATSETFINSNVVFGPDGELLGEYLKNHPVPFGEYVPLRPVFELVPETARVPRDMVRGSAPVVFASPFGAFASVISFEGAFARYSRQAVGMGAQLLVVASNEASYGVSSAADQFLGMTRMRAAENGVDLLHAAVTGASAVITQGGRVGPASELFSEDVVRGEVTLRGTDPTPYTRWGDWFAVVAMATLASTLTWRWLQQWGAEAGPARGRDRGKAEASSQ